MRILVVDDSALYRKILTDAASSALGTEAVAVSNGESALKSLSPRSSTSFCWMFSWMA